MGGVKARGIERMEETPLVADARGQGSSDRENGKGRGEGFEIIKRCL